MREEEGKVMAEICLECWNKENGSNDKAGKYIFSKELELCEECGEYKHTIVMYRSAYYRRKFRYILFPFEIIFRILRIPYVIYCIRKSDK